MALNSAVLRRTELFARLDVFALNDVMRHGRTRRIPRGRTVFRRGDTATACHLLLSGRVRIAQGDRGNQVVIRYVGPGEIFGALALFHGGHYPAEATAVTECVEIQWSSTAITELMRQYPQIALNALSIVGRRLGDALTAAGIPSLVVERDRVAVDTWMGRMTPPDSARICRDAKQQGYRGAKFKCALEDDNVERAQAICDACGGDFKLTLDPHP